MLGFSVGSVTKTDLNKSLKPVSSGGRKSGLEWAINSLVPALSQFVTFASKYSTSETFLLVSGN